jgi:hypothetical protein
LPFISFIWSVVLPERGEGEWLFYLGQECITFLFFVFYCAILPGEGGGEGGSGFLVSGIFSMFLIVRSSGGRERERGLMGVAGGGGVLRGCLLSLLFGVLFYSREGREGGYFTWDKRCITFLFFVV